MSPAVSLCLRAALILTVLAPVDSLDHQAERIVQGWRRPELETPARVVSQYGRVIVFAGLLVVAVATGPSGPATSGVALAVLVPVNLAVEGLKRLVNRPRPDGEHRRSNASFPSSHAANAAALAVVLSRRWRRLAPALWILAALVAGSRLYLNRHFPSDVLGGAVIGVGVGWFALRWCMARGWTWEPKRSG